MRRGQVALEFIMTYGWAILAVLAAIGALAYFGVLSPQRYLPDKCVFTTGIGCQDFIFTGTNGLDLQVTIINNIGDGMIIPANGFNATYKTTTIPCNSAQVTIAAGATSAFTCDNLATTSPGVGTPVKAAISLTYTTTQGVYTKVASGEVSSKVQ